MLGNRTVNIKGAKTITVMSTGHEKSRFTVILSCLANEIKLMPKIKFPSGVLVHVQENGWMDEAGVKILLGQIWDKTLENFNNLSLLAWDMFRSH